MSRDVVAQALKGIWDYAKLEHVALGEVLAGLGRTSPHQSPGADGTRRRLGY
jgi:hypothetical protein